MSFLKKIFGGGGASIEGLRKAVAQKRFADAKLFAEQLTAQSLSEAEVAEVEQLRIAAGDGLARLNLDEALGLQRCGNFELAAEHLHLAQEQVCSVELRENIEQAMAAEPIMPEVEASVMNPSASDPLASCSTSVSQTTTLLNDEDAMFGDAESQLELILTSYPADLAERYAAKNETFKDAFLLSQAGEDEQALPLWQQIAIADQDDLYWFELGSLFARNGKLEEAISMLETALEKNPKLLLALEALVAVLVASGDYPAAEKRLQEFIDLELELQFCYGLLASLYVQQQKIQAAAEPVRKALTAGNGDSGFLLLAASVLEHVEAFSEAEAVLKKLPAAGCRGGTNLPLAEFWLRRKQELATILDTFNAACREYPEEPRWQLRVAQTYLARKWNKDGLKLLKKVVNDPRLDPELAQEAEQLLTECQN